MPRAQHPHKVPFLATLIQFVWAIVLTASLPLAPAMAREETPANSTKGHPAAPPEGLSATDWTGLQERVRQAEYYPTWHAPSAAYTAPNRAQGWQVTFDAAGVQVTPQATDGTSWSWGLALSRYGYAGDLQAVAGNPEPAVDGNQVTLQWDASLSEWYRNDAEGLEHGFTLQAPPPSAGGPLQIEMALRGDLTPHLSSDGAAVHFRDAEGETCLRYDSLAVYDAEGQQLPAHLEISNGEATSTFALRIVVDDSGATYPLTVDPLLSTQVAKLTASDGAAFDYFGMSVAISGDTIVIGAWGNESEKGAAYLFGRNQSGPDAWGQGVKLTAFDGAAGDAFGRCVAIDEDTIVVGAPTDNTGQGAAYLFARNQGGADRWGQVTKLTASDGAAPYYFGISVAISGDTVVIGGRGDNTQPGAAYLFTRNQGGANAWGQVTKFTAADGTADDWFGESVAIDGDTVVVGVPGDDSDQGAAYLFTRNQGGANAWGQVTKLTASDGAAGDRFGISVAIDKDTLVVGADYAANDRGAAYLFTRNGGGADAWGQMTKLTASDGTADDFFGFAVDIGGDTVVVGAYGDKSYRGAVYTFARNQGGANAWGQVVKLTASDGTILDGFGRSVAIDEDTLVASAFGDQNNQGAAYIFAASGESWTHLSHPTASDGAESDQFGYDVAISGDTIVIGAEGDESYQGAAYVLTRNQGGADGWGEVTKLTASDGANWYRFGRSVAIDGDTVVVGAHGNTISQGAAYLFTRNGGGADAWGQVARLTASDGAADDWFGWSVAIEEDTVIIGAPGDDSDRGAAYLFKRNQGGADAWGQVVKLIASDNEVDDRFGIAVAIDSSTVVVGADSADGNRGVAYVFARNQGGADAWGEVARLTASDRAVGDYFGFAVDIDKDTLVVGAYHNGSTRGAAYLFSRNQGGADAWDEVTKLTAADGATLDNFGWSVAIRGDTVVAGAFGDESDRGAAYLFRRNQGGADGWGQVAKLTAAGGAADDKFGRSVDIDGQTVVVGAPGDESSQGSADLFRLEPPPELAITKTATPDTGVTYHSPVTYTVALHNSGLGSAPNTWMTDTLPAHVDFARWVAQPTWAAEASGTVTWNSTVAPGEAITLTFVVTHTGDYSETVSNTAAYHHESSSEVVTATFTVADKPTVTLAVGSHSASEADGTTIAITATASAPVVGEQTVDLDVSGTDITAGDYILNPTRLTLPSHERSATATLTILDDRIDERTEIATLTLTNPSFGIALGSPISQTVTFIDNDVTLYLPLVVRGDLVASP